MVYGIGTEGRLVLLLMVLALSGGPCSSHDNDVNAGGRDESLFSRQWAVHIEGGEKAADAIAAKHGFINLGEIFTDTYHFHHNDVARRSVDPSEEHHGRLTGEPNVRWAKQQVIRRRMKRDFMPLRLRSTPTTTLRPTPPPRPFVLNDPRWPQMWYLNRGGGLDMNVKPAWQEGITGRGIVVTILDDGLEKDHPDLSRNYDPQASFDVNNHDEDPMPRYDLIDSNRHGTRCAGEVAAAANNSICAVGVAFGAGVGGVRMLDGDVTDAVEARSLSLNPQHVDIYSASWGPDDDGKTVDGPGELATRAFVEGVTKGRGGKGSIFVWASGNGGRDHDNCNCDGYTNAIWTLSISSATENGLVPWYSEACSSTLATTYSSGSSGEKQVVTTDLHHQCTTGHTGTSASAPLAAGICALALEANRRLTWRDMQHIVVRTAKPANLRAPDWSVNGVGRNVSHSFGYGLMDASAMVRLARTWKTVPEQHRCEVLAHNVDKQIPAKSQVLLRLVVKECANVNYLEHVQAKISLMSSRRGDLQIHLTSPAGTRSTLLARRPQDLSRSGFQSWPFMTVHSWGEKPLGVWQLEIHNEGRYLGRATLKDWALIFYGTPANPDYQRPPTTIPAPHPSRRGGSSALTPQSTRPRGHPSGSTTKKNKYTLRGRNGTTESSQRNTPMTDLTPPKPTPPFLGPTVQERVPPTQASSSPAFVWGPIYFGDSVTSIPVVGTVSRIADPVRHPQEVISGLRGGPGGVVHPRPPPPPRRPPAGSLPRDGRPGGQAMETAGKGTYGNHRLATLTDWNLLLHGTGTAPGENGGGRPGEGNGITARNSSGDAVKDKNTGRAPPTEAEVIPGGNGGSGRARWKQDGGSSNGGGKLSGPTIIPATGPPPQEQGEWQDRKDQRNGVERTSMEEASGGCNATRGCIECSEGLYLHQGKCEPACPQQRFFVGLDAFSHPACLPCHYTCKACSGPNDYQCTVCFEDSLPFPLHSILEEHNQTEFRCIPSDISIALYSEQWSFWMFVAFLSNAALILLIGAWLCFFGIKRPSSRAHIEGHVYEKVSGNELHPHIRTRESKVIGYVSSEDEDVS